jgi:hypothetical protein
MEYEALNQQAQITYLSNIVLIVSNLESLVATTMPTELAAM